MMILWLWWWGNFRLVWLPLCMFRCFKAGFLNLILVYNYNLLLKYSFCFDKSVSTYYIFCWKVYLYGEWIKNERKPVKEKSWVFIIDSKLCGFGCLERMSFSLIFLDTVQRRFNQFVSWSTAHVVQTSICFVMVTAGGKWSTWPEI